MSAVGPSIPLPPIQRVETPVTEKRLKRKRAPSMTESLYELQSHRPQSPPPPVPALPYMGPPRARTPEPDYDVSFSDAEPAGWCECCRDTADIIALGVAYLGGFLCSVFCR